MWNITTPVCGEMLPRDLLVIIPHTDNHIIDVIKKQHPEWVEKDGICRRCYEYYKSQLHPEENSGYIGRPDEKNQN